MREQPPLLATLPWRTEHDLRYSDLDRQGHVNNGIFDRLFESNRVLMMDTERGYTPQLVRFSLARVEIDFLAELFWPGRVLAAAGVEKFGTASLTFRQGLYRDGACVAASRATVVCVDPQTRKAKPIDESIKALLAKWRITGA